jgi:hypothetical protein
MRHAVDHADFDDCFVQFDAAFESLAAQLADPQNPSPADLEQAFNLLDDRLATCTAAEAALKLVPSSRAPERPDGAGTDVQLASHASIAATLRPLQPAIRSGGTAGGLNPLGNLLAVLENLTIVQRRLAKDTVLPGDPASREAMAGVFADARQLCVDFELQTARVRTDFAIAALEDGHVDRLRTEIEELFRHIRHDVQFCSIWPVATARAWSFEHSFGGRVNEAFPSAKSDISEGGVCLGLGRHSACVFHMTRAAERGVRALARAANAHAASRTDDEWSGWLAIIEARVSDLERWPAGHAQAKAQAFFEGALADARVLHEATRRLGSRAVARPFDEHEATAICNRTKELLVRLSQYVGEEQHKTLTRRDFSH